MEELTLTAIAFMAALIPLVLLFIWNLWLAPYRIMKDSLESAIAIGHLPAKSKPRKVDVSDYREYRNLLLYEAACLWVGINPQHPVEGPGAELKLGQLKNAIRGGELKYVQKNTPADLMAVFFGRTTEKNTSDKQQVMSVELRRYAAMIGDVPEFLSHVQVPLEPPNEPAEVDRIVEGKPDV